MNRLQHATSPYLLQHAHNPVDWFPWGEEALEKAKQENKLILVSIGYSACHWCHVMEKESFEDEEVAAVMNTHFVSIKIDREERPDIDRFYMDAVTIMTQQGGWPLNCIALPDGRPIYGGTYFPKRQWIDILSKLAKMYAQRPDYALEYAERLTDAVAQIAEIPQDESPFLIGKEEIDKMAAEILRHTDGEWGGFSHSQNKFPLPTTHAFLMQLSFYTRNQDLDDYLHLTLKKIGIGGIYDHLAGGFARYSTDTYWKIPHFEKMLYDNAQLVSLYSQAYRQAPFAHPLYKKIIYQTLDFIQKKMRNEEGGFYSAYDADSEGEEGKYYRWKKSEVLEILCQKHSNKPEEVALFLQYYNITQEGNWENQENIFFALETEEEFFHEEVVVKKQPFEYEGMFEGFRQQLLAEREKRIPPSLDYKIITAWNSLMMKGFVEASLIFQEPQWLEVAAQNAEYLWNNCVGSIPRGRDETVKVGPKIYRNAQRTIPGFLDDYAFTIEAYLALYSATFEEKYAYRARLLLYYVMAHFYDEKTQMFFYTEGLAHEWVRKHETADDVIPASCGVLAQCFHTFYLLYGEVEYRDYADNMLQNMQKNLLRSPAWYASWGMLALKKTYPQYEIVVTGENALAFRTRLAQHYRPNHLIAGAVKEGKIPIVQNRIGSQATVYICKDAVCNLPETDMEAAMREVLKAR